MRDHGGTASSSGGADVLVALPSAAALTALAAELMAGSAHDMSDAGRIDLLRALEVVKCAAEGAQAQVTVEFTASQRARAAADGVPAARQGRGIAAQVALARRESPYRAQQHVGFASTARREMPHVWAALRAGRISEYKAILALRETACLELDSRARIDQIIAEDPDRIEAMGDRELAGEIRKLAYALEPRSFVARRAKAEADRHTRLRPAPDTMALFTALLTVHQGVAVHAVLTREADRLIHAGDPRGRGQLMADLLVQRVTNPATTNRATTGSGDSPAAGTSAVPVMVNLMVPDTVLLGDSDEGGWVEGYGPVPGDLIRQWIAHDLETGVDTWCRRLYERPETGDLVSMDSKARRFTGRLADYLRLRDRACRTPWCDAPVRHLDHARPHAEGGPTRAVNSQGLCAACNHAKQVRGWLARVRNQPPDHPEAQRHTIETTTPTGHTYISTAPPIGPLRPRPRIDLAFPIVFNGAAA